MTTKNKNAQTTMRNGDTHPNAPTATNEETALAVPTNDIPPGVLVRGASADQKRALVAGMKMAPRFVQLEAGDAITGTFIRFGETDLAEKLDRLTGTYSTPTVPTVVLGVGGGIEVEFLSAHELKRKLKAARAGQRVTIIRGEDRLVGDRRVTDYDVAIEGA